MSKQWHSRCAIWSFVWLEAKGNMIQLGGNGKSSLWPGCSLFICSLLGFNAFCQILNFTTKCLIMPWHSASGKCTGLESAAVTSSQWKHTLKNLKLHSHRHKLVTHIFKQARTLEQVIHLTNCYW